MEEITDYHKFPAVGHCIYCGSTEGDITDEHIIPYSLNGGLVLPKSSCEVCREATRKNEELCCQERWGMFAPMRARIGAKSRKKSTSKGTIKAQIIHADGKTELKEFPKDSFPAIAYGVLLPVAGILTGQEPSDTVDASLVMRFPKLIDVDIPQTNQLTIGTFRWGVFYKLLAKIAYSYAATKFHRTALLPTLPDIIHDRWNKCPYLIGGKADDDLKPIDAMHKLDLFDYITGDTAYTVVGIHLFGFLGMPHYHVVVGKRAKNQLPIVQ